MNTASLFANIQLPIFDRNQGEIARTRYAITQSQELSSEQASIALTDVTNSYEGLRTDDEVVQLYQSGYLKAGRGFARHQPVRLPARRRQPARFSGRRAELSRHRACLPAGARQLHDLARTIAPGSGNQEFAMTMKCRSCKSKQAAACAAFRHFLRGAGRRVCARRLRRRGRKRQQDDFVLDHRKRGEQGGTVLPAGRPNVAHPDLHRRAGAARAHAAPHRGGGLQRLPDDAGDHASGRAGEPHRGHAGRARDRGPAAAVRHQPRLLADCAPPTSRRATPSSLPTNFTSARRTSTRTKPSRRPISNRPNRTARRRKRTCNRASRPFAFWEFRIPKAS